VTAMAVSCPSSKHRFFRFQLHTITNLTTIAPSARVAAFPPGDFTIPGWEHRSGPRLPASSRSRSGHIAEAVCLLLAPWNLKVESTGGLSLGAVLEQRNASADIRFAAGAGWMRAFAPSYWRPGVDPFAWPEEVSGA